MNTANDNTVVELDIRDASTEDAEDRAYEVMRGFRFNRSSGRVVVIDDALSVADHESIYRIIQAHQGANLLCVAVGGPASRASGIALRTTQLLNNQTAATLWVGDPDGVSWPTRTMPANDEPLLATQPETLRSLREILNMHEVFDQVIKMAEQWPFHVASPGHLVAAGQVGPVQLASAQLASVDQVAGEASGLHERPPVQNAAANDYWPLITTESPNDVDPTRLRRDSPLYTAHSQADQLLRTAQNEALAVDGPLGPKLTAPPSPALEETVAAGRKLAEFHRSVRDLFNRVDVREGLSTAARDRLTHSGIDMRELPGSTHREIAARLKERLAARFTSGMSLRETAESSRELADHATTAGTKGRLADLDAACPASLLDRLADPPELPWRLLTPWVLGVVAASGLLAALGPFGRIIGIVVALAWSFAVFAATTRLPAVGDRRVGFDPRLLAHLGAALAGAAGGVAITDTLHPPALLGWICLAGPAVALLLTMRFWWSRATRQWGLPGLIRAGQHANAAILQLLYRVAVREWVANDARRFVAHGAYEIGSALDAVADALGGWLPPTRPGGPVDVRTFASEELQRLITEDIRHVVGMVLSGGWRALEAGTFDDISDGVRQRTVDLLDQYSLHLENVGIDEPFQPDADTPPRSRSQLVRKLWQESTEINWLMYDAGADSPMVQLCGPEDVFLLDGERERFGLIRFAPRAARESVTASRPGGYPNADITWTGASHIAGVLRLVPLRGKAVESGWSASEETDVYQ